MNDIDAAILDALRRARATTRAKVWESFGAAEETSSIEAALVRLRSANKEKAASHDTGGYGFARVNDSLSAAIRACRPTAG